MASGVWNWDLHPGRLAPRYVFLVTVPCHKPMWSSSVVREDLPCHLSGWRLAPARSCCMTFPLTTGCTFFVALVAGSDLWSSVRKDAALVLCAPLKQDAQVVPALCRWGGQESWVASVWGFPWHRF